MLPGVVLKKIPKNEFQWDWELKFYSDRERNGDVNV